ncbi:hypothetical protein [Shewanella nanhaiensis]|uniref:PqqD family protein n=1 Tax=Shewanella nanhaiensis TaxID=2864872 RepID=A0ABS7E8J9_9GAMM|nr:hypothetical protein [Shewanella nanhaiensis]MBW8185352.1 hypothetical protein [Shewanella nanhaiensis]
MDKAQYFYRTVIFTRQGDQVSLVDIDNPQERTPLEGWMGIALSLADGRHTLNELIDYIGSQYQTVPQGLADTLDSVIERLLEGKMVKLSSKPIELPYYLSEPIELLDIERARRLIGDDGYH